MVNHTRTLLMNRGRDGANPQAAGEEYVPATYHAKKLPLPVRLLWQALFGSDPDRVFLNYRLQQLMPLIHVSELESIALRKDRRVTYWPPISSSLDIVFGVDVLAKGATGGLPYVTGDTTCDEGVGRCRTIWDVTVLPLDTLRIDKITPPTKTATVTLLFSSGLSQLVELLGTSLFLRFPATIESGDSWRITSLAPPPTDISLVLYNAAAGLGAAGITGLLTDPTVEPDKTLQAIWATHPVTAYRYGAMLLALAEKIDTLPQERA